MRLLVIGGTVFLGRAVVAAALARGHAVTIFHRGVHNPDLFPEAEHLLGDRTRDLSALRGRDWDAVIDTCGFEPEHVGAAAELLADRVAHYGFVSSGSVYPGWGEVPVTEDSPVFESDEREYGQLKAACERAAEEAMPGRVLAARAGVIVGPHENVGRLPRWLHRLAEGGDVLAPGPPDAPIQLIDARDLAAWMLDMAAAGRAGAYNAIAPPGSASWGELLEAARAVTGGRAELRWADPAWVEARVEEPWTELPLWPIPSLPGLYGMAGARAAAAGLAPRPLGETVADTWAWLGAGGTLDDWRAEVRASGLSGEAERELLAALPS
jgi:2'-hydroxyisoflavone reductase